VSVARESSLNLFNQLQLERHPGNKLTAKKITSISEKYITIPKEYLSYYPTLEDVAAAKSEMEVEGDDENEAPAPAAPASTKKRKVTKDLRDTVPGAKKPGPVKKNTTLPVNQSSILTFFNTK